MEDRLKAPIPVNDLNSYPNASLKKKSDIKPMEKEKVEPTISTTGVKFKKQSNWKKAKHKIFKQEMSEVKTYIVDEFLIPTFKDLISSMLTNTVDMLLYGEVRHNSRRIIGDGGPKYGNYVNYSTVRGSRGGLSTSSRGGFSTASSDYLEMDELIFDTRGKAVNLLNSMRAIINEYGVISVARMYDFLYDEDEFGNKRPIVAPSTYNNYGWYNLDAADVILTRSGYLLKLPPTKCLI